MSLSSETTYYFIRRGFVDPLAFGNFASDKGLWEFCHKLLSYPNVHPSFLPTGFWVIIHEGFEVFTQHTHTHTIQTNNRIHERIATMLCSILVLAAFAGPVLATGTNAVALWIFSGSQSWILMFFESTPPVAAAVD